MKFHRLYLKAKPILWRALLCWALGSILLLNDERSSFDTRFQIRGALAGTDEVVVITIRAEEIAAHDDNGNHLSTWKDGVDFTDSYYWDPVVWKKLIGKVLKQKPRSVGVALYFPESLTLAGLEPEDLQRLKDPRIIWGTPSPDNSRNSAPLFSNFNMSNAGSFDLVRDEDGVIRKFYPGGAGATHFSEKAAKIGLNSQSPKIINYQGGNQAWTKYTLREVLSPNFPKDSLFGKVVIIGSESDSVAQYLTPFGATSRAHILAQITENLINQRWIQRAPVGVYSLLLLAILFVCVLILLQYPQAVAAALMMWMGTFIAALSVWTFDTFYIWIPVFSPLVQIGTTWMVFLGYQANKLERKNFELRQDQRLGAELEQLKSNFVSLISHDLKTPLAKIQGVADRLIFENQNSPLKGDLELVKQYSEELNRYIKSILKVLQVESREFRLSLEVGDINEMIETAISPLLPLAQDKQIQIEKNLEPLFSFEGDFNLLREVVMNVVENAIKYSPQGGRVQIQSTEVDEFVIIRIQDNGPGIPAEELPLIWRKFVRGKDQDLKTKGTGLGLYLVKYFIELHGGQVSVKSELGQGTQFTIQLPVETEFKTGGQNVTNHLSAYS